MKKLLLAAAVAALLPLSPGAMAADYPSRPITMVVPLSVGGSTDVIGRIVAQGMGEALGQTVIVENTTGAGGTIGEGRISRAAPDGYTIGIGQWGTNVADRRDLQPALRPDEGFRADRADCNAALLYHRAQNDAGQQSQGADRLAARETATRPMTAIPASVRRATSAAFCSRQAVGAPLTMVPYRGAGDSTAGFAGRADRS